MRLRLLQLSLPLFFVSLGGSTQAHADGRFARIARKARCLGAKAKLRRRARGNAAVDPGRRSFLIHAAGGLALLSTAALLPAPLRAAAVPSDPFGLGDVQQRSSQPKTSPRRSGARRETKHQKAKPKRDRLDEVVSPVTRGVVPRNGHFGAPRPGHKHGGLDISLPKGSTVRAATDGIVVTKRQRGGYGLAVFILRSDGVKTVYGHLSSFAGISEGQQVKAGEVIGRSGNTGTSRGKNGGYHLHFEWRTGASNRGGGAPLDGTPQNPKRFIREAPGYPL